MTWQQFWIQFLIQSICRLVICHLKLRCIPFCRIYPRKAFDAFSVLEGADLLDLVGQVLGFPLHRTDRIVWRHQAR